VVESQVVNAKREIRRGRERLRVRRTGLGRREKCWTDHCKLFRRIQAYRRRIERQQRPCRYRHSDSSCSCKLQELETETNSKQTDRAGERENQSWNKKEAKEGEERNERNGRTQKETILES
jgi:hypothetical protein